MQDRIETLRKMYPKGARVELIRMNDIQSPKAGTLGTVIGVDDIGSIMVRWDTGSSLNVILDEDLCFIHEPIKTICYKKEQTWNKRAEALDFFYDCVANSEGSERDRYLNIIDDIFAGKTVCVGIQF